MNFFVLLFLNAVLSSELFIGSWQGQLSNFTTYSGLVYLLNSTSSSLLLFCLYNGNWKSDETLCFNSTAYRLSDSSSYQLISTAIYYKEDEVISDIKGSLLKYKGQTFQNVSGEFHSPDNIVNFSYDCKKVSTTEYYSSAYIFLIIYTIVKTLDFYICKHIFNCCSNRLQAQSLSLSSIILSSSVDLFYMLWSLDLAGNGEVSFIQITLIQLIVMTAVSIIILREKSRIFDKIVRSQSLSRRRHGFSTYLFIAGLYISTLNTLYYLNTIASNLVFLPQLLKNYMKKSVPKHFIAVLIINQLALSLSITLWSGNFLVWEPDFVLSGVNAALVTAQLIYLAKFVMGGDFGEDLQPLLTSGIRVSGNSRVENIGTTCSICLCEYGEQEVAVTNCGHGFHTECIQGWIRINAVCPVCRNEVFELMRY